MFHHLFESNYTSCKAVALKLYIRDFAWGKEKIALIKLY